MASTRREKEEERALAAAEARRSPFGAYTYITPELRQTRAVQRAEELESTLPKGLWSNPASPTDVLEVLIDAWEEAGFGGWADNYRAEVERRRGTGRSRRDARPTPAQRQFISQKIRILRREGYEQRQAIAIAHRMAGVPPRKQGRRRDPVEGPPKSGVRLRQERRGRTSKRYRAYDHKGVRHYPFALEFTTDDGRQRRKVLYAPNLSSVRGAIRRFFDAEDMVILPGSTVRARWLPFD